MSANSQNISTQPIWLSTHEINSKIYLQYQIFILTLNILQRSHCQTLAPKVHPMNVNNSYEFNSGGNTRALFLSAQQCQPHGHCHQLDLIHLKLTLPNPVASDNVKIGEKEVHVNLQTAERQTQLPRRITKTTSTEALANTLNFECRLILLV